MHTISLFLIALALLISGCIYIEEPGQQQETALEQNNYPEQTPNYEPRHVPTPTPAGETYGDLAIDNISRELDDFYKRGWHDLYERNEFDCSRMTTYLWDYIRTRYKIAPEIFLAPDRKHAWLALKVVDAGDTDRYLQWNIKGVKYYYLETTVPEVVKSGEKFSIGGVVYDSPSDFYTTRIYPADDPVEANTIAGRWFNEFRLTKSDIDKLDSFKIGNNSLQTKGSLIS
ncbi:MAG TPA: hypothetical protein VIO58_01265 [Candidatus Methanoperedens sp.]